MKIKFEVSLFSVLYKFMKHISESEKGNESPLKLKIFEDLLGSSNSQEF